MSVSKITARNPHFELYDFADDEEQAFVINDKKDDLDDPDNFCRDAIRAQEPSAPDPSNTITFIMFNREEGSKSGVLNTSKKCVKCSNVIKYNASCNKIFCELFEKIKLMKGDGFLKKLFPDEDITSASEVVYYSVYSEILEKMHQWIEDINLIIMMQCVARHDGRISQSLEAQDLLANNMDRSSLEDVHTRAENFTTWINRNNNMLLNIKELYFYNLGLTSLPSEIGFFINLRVLLLEDNYLTELPLSIGTLTNLQELYIYNNYLTELPSSIGDLENLRVFGADNNYLKELPDSIGNLQKLQAFTLHKNHLRGLPSSIGNLRSLERITLPADGIIHIPDMSNFLTNVKKSILENFCNKVVVSYLENFYKKILVSHLPTDFSKSVSSTICEYL